MQLDGSQSVATKKNEQKRDRNYADKKDGVLSARAVNTEVNI
jgi:hypothetical protein